MEQLIKGIKVEGDRVVWAVVIILSLFSVVAVYTATGSLAFNKQAGNTEYYLLKHVMILLMGFGIMYLAHYVRYQYYSRIAQILLFIAVPLLAVTLATGQVNGASRWIMIPVINLTFQSSDFAKLALVMYLARILSKKQENIKSFKEAFVPIMLPVGIVCMLILPANFSTAALLFTTCIVLMFIGRVSIKYIAATVGCAIVAFGLFLLVMSALGIKGRTSLWLTRIETFFNKDEKVKDDDKDYQVDHAKMAVAGGGIIGKGPGHSIQRISLPHPYSDFIYAIIIEEYGFMGGMTVLVLYLILLLRGVKIAANATTPFGTLLAMGCCFMLVFQAMINMAVAVNLFPVTGQSLPLISMGGTSIWFTSLAIGILLSVSRKDSKETAAEAHTMKGGEYAMA
jgi:cell division protein FtsW